MSVLFGGVIQDLQLCILNKKRKTFDKNQDRKIQLERNCCYLESDWFKNNIIY